MSWEIRQGDCVERMRELPDCSVDAVVTDPPYGIGFMGKEWDGAAIRERAQRDAAARRDLGPHSDSREGRAQPRSSSAFGDAAHYAGPVSAGLPFQEFSREWAAEALRVLKPGGHLIAFAGTRTYHRMVCGVEDAGFEIRDQLAWLFGSGFPKSLDVSKAIDKQAGAERPDAGPNPNYRDAAANAEHHERWNGAVLSDRRTAPATPEAEQWDGWGTALKPAHEPIVLARKPLTGTVAGNVLEHGTGALNVDGCRIEGPKGAPASPSESRGLYGTFNGRAGEASAVRRYADQGATDLAPLPGPRGGDPAGRWPANVVLDEQAARMLDEQTGMLHSQDPATRRSRSDAKGVTAFGTGESVEYADRGGASRFLYVAKASRAERNAGCDAFEKRALNWSSGEQSPGTFQADGTEREARNHHPTVKPIDLMRWLVRLVTPPGGKVLDPFTGSGSTGCAAVLEGFEFIGLEREADYVEIAKARVGFWAEHGEGALVRMQAAERAERAAVERAARELAARAAAGQLDLLGGTA